MFTGKARILFRLLALLPEAGFMGEESIHSEDWTRYEWLFIVDPIDGTTNFVQGYANSCVSIGLLHKGLVEYGLVQELGRLDTIGRPIVFGTTEEFLRSFGVSSIEELPDIDEVQKQNFFEEASQEISDAIDVPV